MTREDDTAPKKVSKPKGAGATPAQKPSASDKPRKEAQKTIKRATAPKKAARARPCDGNASSSSAMDRGGAIVLTASVAGVKGMAGRSVYSATKAALRSFGRTFATELAPRGIRVNTISPGPIDTPIFGKTGLSPEQVEAFVKDIASRIPLGRQGRAEEVAAAALFLASDDASFTTGTELFVDGGMADL